MKRKLRNFLKNLLVKYKPSEEEVEFINLNSKFWSSTEQVTSSQKTVLVEGFLSDPVSSIEKARIAKAIQEETLYTPIIILRGLFPKTNGLYNVFESFNIHEYVMWWRGYLDPKFVIPSIYQTIHLYYLVNHKGIDLTKYTFKGLLIGDLVYDTLVRFVPNSYTINKLNRKHFRLVFRSFFFYFQNKYIIDKFNVNALVTSHNVYAEFGLLSRQVHSKGGVVFLKDMSLYKCYHNDNNIREHFLKLPIADFKTKISSSEILNKAQKYFDQRVLGNIDQIDVKNAYTNKKRYSKNELLNHFGLSLSTDLPIALVMAHAFSDAPHVGESLLFKDYYDWLVKTLKCINKNTNVLTFVKTHPSSYLWGEKGVVEEILIKYDLSNIYIVPNDLNTSSLYDFTDILITAKGTAGLEFSAAGKYVITAGKGYYSGFGFVAEPETIEDYYNLLNELPHHSWESINNLFPKYTNSEVAKIYLYLVSLNKLQSEFLPSQILPGENYDALYRSKYKLLSSALLNNANMKDYFYQLIKSDAKKYLK